MIRVPNAPKKPMMLEFPYPRCNGRVTHGTIGFEGRYDYGALGPVTNLAPRLSTCALPNEVLISQRVVAAVEEAVDVEPVGEIELKGFARPVPAYEVRSLTGLA